MIIMKYALIMFLALSCGSIFSQNVISVLYFENTTQNEDYQWLQKGLADMLISDLSGTPGLKIVERVKLEQILQEQALSLTGLVEEGPSKKVGELLAANKLLYGGYIVADDEIRIDLKISDVASGQIIAGHTVKGDLDDIFQIQAELGQFVREQFKSAAGKVKWRMETKSITALARYYTGMDHLDNKRYKQARTEFAEAMKLDPLYLKAQQGLAESYKFLKAFKKYRQQNEITKLYAKIDALQTRLDAPEWLTFADIVMTPEYQTMTAQEQQDFLAENNELALCNSPAQCTWHIMLTFDEIGRKSVEYFADIQLEVDLLDRIVQIGEESRNFYAKDPFLSEILYFQIYAFYRLKNYEKLKSAAEAFLMNYPDYRMIETVENYYQNALDELVDKQ